MCTAPDVVERRRVVERLERRRGLGGSRGLEGRGGAEGRGEEELGVHLFVGCVSASGARVACRWRGARGRVLSRSVAAVALLTSSSAACAAGGVCVLVAKRARCCASAPRPLLRVPWARARAVTRIDARFAATHVPVVPRAADFHRVFAGIGSIRCRRRVARFKMCVSCNGDAGRGCSRFMCWTARFVWFGHLRLLQSSDSRVCRRVKPQTPVLGRRLGRSEYASARWASWERAPGRERGRAAVHSHCDP